jgi:hypothetical protein
LNESICKLMVGVETFVVLLLNIIIILLFSKGTIISINYYLVSLIILIF